MFVILSKFLPLFLYPLGLACLLLVLALLLTRRPAWQRLFTGVALFALLAGSSRWVSNGLARSLEWRYLPPAEMPEADVIVVLGGSTLAAQYPRPIVEVNGAGDRVIYAAWLYKQGKAPHLLLSGGVIDWLSSGPSPAENMADLLGKMGVPQQAIWLESTSQNTYENAVNSRQILQAKGIRRIILVTSAMHMPRAVGLFEKQGLQVIPAPTDFTATQAQAQPGGVDYLLNQAFNLLPSAEDLALTSRVLKEYLGLFVYRLRGWL